MTAQIQDYILAWLLLHDQSFQVWYAPLYAVEGGLLVFVEYLFFELAFGVVLGCQAQATCLAAGLVLDVLGRGVYKFELFRIHEAVGGTEGKVDLSGKFLVKSAQTSTVDSQSGLLHPLLPALEYLLYLTQTDLIHFFSLEAAWQAGDEYGSDAFEGVVLKRQAHLFEQVKA